MLLAQFDLAPRIEPLPSPPAIPHLLFEWPFGLAAGLTILGLFLYYILNRRGRGRSALVAAAAGICLALTLLTIATLVRTEREALAERTTDLAEGVLRTDPSAAEIALSTGNGEQSVSLVLVGVTIPMSRSEMIRRVTDDLGGRYSLRSHALDSLTASLDGPNAARTQFRVRATLREWGFSVSSWWRLYWRLEPAPGGRGVWRVTGIEALHIDGVPPGTRIDP
ncbi:MAG: hypothetical protein JNM07_07650 [Phycisphaerae bacterium]|nr:hypothetical protein [Phycisphaerae bacterium]